MSAPLKRTYAGAAALFALSLLVTSIFSASLKVFFGARPWSDVLLKGILIPCLTWAVLLALSLLRLDGARRAILWRELGLVCLVGSLALMPAAALNLSLARPPVLASVANVLASVALMGVVLDRRLAARGFDRRWALAWCALIALNMTLYLSSVLP